MNNITEIINNLSYLWANQMWVIIWQTSVLAGLIVIVTFLFRRLSAAVKFWLWMLVPLRLLVMPLITISLPLLPAIAPQHIEQVDSPPTLNETAAVEYSPARIGNLEFPEEPFNFTPVQPLPAEVQEQEAEPEVIRIKPNLWTFLMIAWFAGIAFWTIRLLWSWRKIRRIVHNTLNIEKKRIIEQASKAAEITGLKKAPEILVTRENISPFLYGIFRPVLIVPSGFVNNVSSEGLLAVFSHEFAHLRRKDTLVGWILAICEAFYFFHPVLHFAKRRILFERERACDDWVIASGNSHKKIYANALIDAAGICRNFSAGLGPAGVVAESFGDLKKRIIAIGSNLKPKTRLSKTALVLLILMGTICVPDFVLTNKTSAKVPQEKEEIITETLESHEQSSQAWYILRQWNVAPLLLGLAQRLGNVVESSQQSDPVWTGVNNGGSLKLDITVEDDIQGDIFIGLFKDPKWSVEPVQVRKYPGQGQFVIENIPPGKYQIGAMLGSLPKPIALGVQQNWPEYVEIKVGQETSAQILLSVEFQKWSSGWYNEEVSRDFVGDWKDMDNENLLQGQLIGPNGKEISFGEIMIREYNPNPRGGIAAPNRGTNEKGYYKFDGIEWPYTITTVWKDLMPSIFGYRFQQMYYNEVLEGKKTVDFNFEEFPTGTAKLTGKVSDQNGDPLSEFFINVHSQFDSTEMRKNPDGKYYNVVGYQKAFISEDGSFEMDNLPSGEFSVRVVPFDIQAYERISMDNVIFESGKTANVDIKLTSKNIFYGRVLLPNGSPAVVKPEPWLGAKTSILLPMGSFASTIGELDDEGYFSVKLSDREIESMKSGTNKFVINMPLSDENQSKTVGRFSIEKLSKNKNNVEPVELEWSELPQKSLLNNPLPQFDGINIDFDINQAKDTPILVCFWDLEQRPSRNCLLELSKRADDLAQQGISVIAVHASEIEKDTLDAWLKENNITMTLGIVEVDEKQIRFNWAIQSLPQMILTDKQHIVTDEGFGIDELDEKIKNINENPVLETSNSKELLEKLRSLDNLYISSLTLTGTDIRVPEYPDVPRQKIRWKISMHQDEFALEQISDEIYERKSSQRVDGLLGTPSMMMKAVVYMSKQRGGHHYIFGNVLEPGKAPEPEDNMIGGQVLINKTKPDYFIVSKIRYLWSIGRYYSKYIDKIVEVSTDNNGIMTITAAGQMIDKIQGQWELQINPAAMYMVQDAKFTRFDSQGQLSETPEIIINNSGVKWFENLCIPLETSCTGLGNNVNVPINYESISQKADLEFIKQANEFLDPPYKVQTTHSIISGSSHFDSMYEAGEKKANTDRGNDTNNSFSEELLYLRQRNASTFGVTALIEGYEKLISKYENDSRVAKAFFDLANIYETERDNNKALELFEAASEKAIPNTDIWKKANFFWFGRLLNEDIQKAEKILLDMKNHLNKNDVVLEAEIEDRYVCFYGMQRRFDEAEKSYSKVLELYEDRTKTTENIEDRVAIADCWRTSSQTLLASIQYAVELTPAERLIRIKKLGEKYHLFSIFNNYEEAVKQLESQVSWQDMSAEMEKQQKLDKINSSEPEFVEGEISGVVEDPDGKPINAASVEILNRELVLFPDPGGMLDTGNGIQVTPPSYAARTDIHGYFKIADLSSGKTDMIIRAVNCRTKILKDISTGTTDLKIVLDKPAAFKLKGEVVDSRGNPVKDVKITLVQNLDKAESKSIQTDDKGLFEFDDVLEPTTERNTRELIAQKDGFAIWGKWLDSTGGESYVKITLLPEETVSGRVVDDKGKPIAGAEVHFWSCSSGEGIDFYLGLWQDIAPSVKTGSDGKFIFKGIPPKCNVYFNISAEGYVSNSVQSLNNGYDGGYFVRQKDGTTETVIGGINETQGDIVFVLKKGATLRGTVTYKDTGLPAERIRLFTQSQEGEHPEDGVSWVEGITDKNGRFELKGVSPNPCNLLVEFENSADYSMPEWTAAAKKFDNLKPGKVKDNIKIVLIKGGIMRGKVTDAKGNPLHGIRIAFYSSARPLSSAACQGTYTAKDGTWSYRFPPGEVYAYVQTDLSLGMSWSKYSYTKKIKEGREIKNIDFKLDCELPENSPYR